MISEITLVYVAYVVPSVVDVHTVVCWRTDKNPNDQHDFILTIVWLKL